MTVTALRSCITATDALLRADERAFDLVILDLNLPDIDGLEVAERLRADAHPGSEVSILMLTARGDVGSRGRRALRGSERLSDQTV